eukprot:GFUD01021103.1.p1 GENE.GFUD01021103.1~~GFUD01021103.1.p1  ORF type:complete len:188 (-),score=64.68 GFUD01021103.1:316-852(-)
MIGERDADTATEHSNNTGLAEPEDVSSTNAEEYKFFPVNANNPNTLSGNHVISPFVMAVAGAGIMFSVFLCSMVALLMRMAMKRRLDKKRKGLDKRKASISSGCGGFEQPPRFGPGRPIRMDRLYFPNRSMNYPTHCQARHNWSMFHPNTGIQSMQYQPPYYPSSTPPPHLPYNHPPT